MTDSRKRDLRILYTAGPGDVIGSYVHWREGRDDPGQVAITYSGQFFELCRQIGASGYAIASHPRRQIVDDGQFRVDHRPIPFARSKAPLYHLGQVLSGLAVIYRALRWRANVAVICDGTCHWFVLRLLSWMGIKVIPTIHCVLWPQGTHPPGGLRKLIRRLNRPLWQRSATAILSASDEISGQIGQITDNRHRPIIEFLPTYRAGTFPPRGDPPAPPPFRVLFAGRIERFKGVFNLLQAAKEIAQSGRGDIEFDLCGTGSQIDPLRRQVREANLADRFRLHGQCARPVMRQMFQSAHVLVVPNTSEFGEGFNQVVVEAILAGRPVITSNMCPALHYVRDAAVEVAPDDVAQYRDAILRLCDDREFYRQKQSACLALQGQFYDPSRGWAAALQRAIGMAGSDTRYTVSQTLPLQRNAPGRACEPLAHNVHLTLPTRRGA